MKSNCELMSRAACAQCTVRDDGWTRPGRWQQTADVLSMQFDVDAPVSHEFAVLAARLAGVSHR